MFMRTVKMHVRTDAIGPFTTAYERSIIPAFAGVSGCRSAVLMQSTREPEECVSLTFWSSEDHIIAFESSGRYDMLVDVLRPFFIESYELQVRLTEDLKLTYGPSNEPEVRRFEASEFRGEMSTDSIIVRMVSLKFRSDTMDAFRRHYYEDVVPALRKLEGCRRAFLAAPADRENELISVTEWESEEAAQAYEHGGKFDALLTSQKHYFPKVVEMTLEGGGTSHSRIATSEDITVDKHRVLVGKRF
jgi:heme-degrading monooxygenase HmoA